MDFGLAMRKKNIPLKNNAFDLRIKPLKHSKPRRISSPQSKRPYHSVAKLKEMNWQQAKKAVPGLNPMGDVDYDGTRNKFDCKVFDPARDGKFSDFVRGVASKVSSKFKKKVTPQKRLSSDEWKKKKMFEKVKEKVKERDIEERKQKFQEFKRKLNKADVIGRVERSKVGKITRAEATKAYAGYGAVVRRVAEGVSRPGTTGTSKSGKKYATAGRPAGQYKTRINPFTGKPIQIPATEFYALKKKFKQAIQMRAKATAERTDVAQTQALARRGIPPEQARQLVDSSQERAVGIVPEEEQIQQVQASQEQVTPQEVQPTEMQQRMARLRAIKTQRELQRAGVVPQQQMSQQMPQQPQQVQYQQQPQYPQQYPQQRVRLKRDIMSGRVIASTVPPQEKWTQVRPHRRPQYV